MELAARRLVPILTLLAAGCDAEPLLTPSSDRVVSRDLPPGSRFDSAGCGRIAGRVTWMGEAPTAPPFLFGVPRDDGSVAVELIPNANVPAIEAKTRSVAGAVVFLRGIDPTHSKPWDSARLTVEMKDRGIRIRRGETEARSVGFARRGETVALVSADPLFHVLRGRGAAFFSHTFPEPGSPISRTFDQSGRVDLSSGAGFYWASATLFVDDHPYYTVTDVEGRFALDAVPAGPVEVVVWHPNWVPVRQDRDPESGLVSRLHYGAPLEAPTRLELAAGTNVDVALTLP